MKPNIIYIYADDLGRGMLSCYSQKWYRTPNIDRIAAEGMRFTRSYAQHICAPSRACLITGQHDVHAGRWTFNRAGMLYEVTEGRLTWEQAFEVINNTGIRPRADQLYLATVAARAGYFTGQIGKLEWGFCTTADEIRAHGWQYHFGYYDHLQAHGYYPPFIFEDGRRVEIPGNSHPRFGATTMYGEYPDGRVPHDPAGRAVHSQDLYDRKIVEFLQAHQHEPFFLYHPTQLPHGPVYYPDVFPEVANNPNLTPVEKEYASMVLRLDQTVGLILSELDRLGLSNRTLLIFSADNGHYPCYEQPDRLSASHDRAGNRVDNFTTKFYSDTCGDILNGNDGMAGLKQTNWEGGVRTPLLARWPGVVPAGTVSHHLVANYDLLATVAECAGFPLPANCTDGISFLPVLRGHADAPEHDHVVYASQFGPCLVTREGWKLRVYMKLDKIVNFGVFGAPLSQVDEAATYQLYYLPDDYREERDLAKQHPEKVAELRATLLQECDGNLVHGTPEAHFAFFPIEVPAKA